VIAPPFDSRQHGGEPAGPPSAGARHSSEAKTLAIHLLGPPRVEIDGSLTARSRGRKAWALLAVLLLTESPISRDRLAALLVPDADDPLGALRWNLAELRRLLGDEAQVGGDPVQLALPPDAVVDVRVIGAGTWVEAERVPGLGAELLEGIDVGASAAFEAWLLTERRRLANLSASVLREAALAHLARGEPDAAVELATRLVALDEFDEEAQVLLIRAHAAAGGIARARGYLAATVERFRRELGTEPSAQLLDAATAPDPIGPGVPAIHGPSAVASLLDAGEAAVVAGIFDAGVDILQRSAVAARELGDLALEARAQVALGTAFVHGGRARDGEGATALHAAIKLAEEVNEPLIASEAARELGYAEMKRGRYDRAETWLERALTDAPDAGSRAAALAVRGVVATDRGRTAPGIVWLAAAAEGAATLAKPRRQAWALAFLGRSHVLREEVEPARNVLERSVDIARAAGWISFLSFPQSLLAEVDMLQGRDDEAAAGFEAAFALGCQVADPCWEGLAARGIGLIHARRGRIDEAVAWLDDARTRCMRIADAYLWMHAHCLDSLCAVGVEHGLPGASAWVADLESVTARTGLREMMARAQLHRVQLGLPGAREAAELFAQQVDNPALHRLLTVSVAA
jgi:DNA-binding SARP family transcriptional activator